MNGLVLTDKNTVFKVEARNWEEAVRVAGGLLVEQGCAKQEYVEGIVRAIQTMGPYIVIADGIAIPHTRPEEGALAIGCALVTLKEPVYFDGDLSPVKVLISFSAIDSNSHIEILQMIVQFIEMELIDKIAEVDSYGEFLELSEKRKGRRESL